MIHQITAGGTPDIVAQYATQRHALDPRSTNLLGIFGPKDNLRALVRQSGGAVNEVKPGQRFAGGMVVAIDAEGVMLLKAGQTKRISIPGS